MTSSDRPKEAVAVRKQRLAAALEGLNYFRSRDLLGDNTSDIQGVTLTETKGPARPAATKEGRRPIGMEVSRRS